MKANYFTNIWTTLLKSCPIKNDENRYDLSEWEEYARIFASITTPAQMEVYTAASTYLKGSVLDAGSGTGKIGHYLNDNLEVTSYTGVDFSHSMVTMGNEILQRLNRPTFTLKHCKIEEVKGCFDSAVSIQSFYAWPKPELTLKHIYQSIASNGIFVLATANDSLDLQPLIKDAEKVLAGHPNMEIYKQHNIKLAENTQGNFICLDDLIKLVQKIGFRILEANQQKFFHGGLNFLILQKS